MYHEAKASRLFSRTYVLMTLKELNIKNNLKTEFTFI